MKDLQGNRSKLWSGPNLKVIIAGGGIGGLVTGLQLHAIGITDIDVFEASRSLIPLGVGINLMPSAVLILRDLGLLDALVATGIETGYQNFYNHHGQLICSEKRGMAAGYDLPQISIHRGALHAILLTAFKERVGADRIHADHCLTSFIPNKDSSSRVTANFTRRSDPATPPEFPTCTADLLIGADGINSAVRAQLYPDEGPPLFSGVMMWRGVVKRAPVLDGRSMCIFDMPKQRFVSYPICKRTEEKDGSALVNWVAELRISEPDDPAAPLARRKVTKTPDWTQSVHKERFAAGFSSWNFGFLNIPEVINSSTQVYEFPMCDREPLKQWSFGRVTLLGDAAHPMYPFGSNGGTQAILDAKELAMQLLASPTDVERALTAYDNLRCPATAKIVLANRGLGPDGPREELANALSAYKALAGFDIESVNKRARESAGAAARFNQFTALNQYLVKSSN